jgi:hypothetical protein
MRRLILLALVALSGCVTTRVQPGAESVRVTTNADVVQGCEYLGAVKASDRMNGGLIGQDAAEENVDRRLKNKTHAMGGNVVHVQRGGAVYAGASMRGEAYRCD